MEGGREKGEGEKRRESRRGSWRRKKLWGEARGWSLKDSEGRAYVVDFNPGWVANQPWLVKLGLGWELTLVGLGVNCGWAPSFNPG